MSNETGQPSKNMSVRTSSDESKRKSGNVNKNRKKFSTGKKSKSDNNKSEWGSQHGITKSREKKKTKRSTKKKFGQKEIASPSPSFESPAPLATPKTISTHDDSKSKSKSDKQTPSEKKKSKEPWYGLEAGRKWVEKNIETEKLATEFGMLETIDAKKPTIVSASFPNKNRNERNVVYDDNRVVLNRSKIETPNYINASRINVSEFRCRVIVAQVPINKKEDSEDFWQMIYQEKVSVLFLATNKNETEPFYPVKTDEFVYYGKMFVNNKKTEIYPRMEVLTLEVLPNGNSDSIICKILHLSSWGTGRKLRIAADIKKIMDEFMSEIKIQHIITICMVSMNGKGQACALLAAVVANTALSRNFEPNIFNIMKEIKEQRHEAIENFSDYAAIYLFVTRYIKSYTREDQQLQQKVNTMIKALNVYTTKAI